MKSRKSHLKSRKSRPNGIQWINKNKPEGQVLSHPDIKGWVVISNDGSQNAASDKFAEQLGDVLIYFNEVSDQIGETFGLDKIDEIHIVCEEHTAICMTGRHETIGVIFDKDTRPNQFLAKYKAAR